MDVMECCCWLYVFNACRSAYSLIVYAGGTITGKESWLNCSSNAFFRIGKPKKPAIPIVSNGPWFSKWRRNGSERTSIQNASCTFVGCLSRLTDLS